MEECREEIPVVTAPMWAYDENTKCIKIRTIHNKKVYLNPDETKIFLMINSSNTIEAIINALEVDKGVVISFLADLKKMHIISYQSEVSSIWGEEDNKEGDARDH